MLECVLQRDAVHWIHAIAGVRGFAPRGIRLAGGPAVSVDRGFSVGRSFSVGPAVSVGRSFSVGPAVSVGRSFSVGPAVSVAHVGPEEPHHRLRCDGLVRP